MHKHEHVNLFIPAIMYILTFYMQNWLLILYILLYRPLREDGHLSLKYAAGFMLMYSL
jgi:hypothetical protein